MADDDLRFAGDLVRVGDVGLVGPGDFAPQAADVGVGPLDLHKGLELRQVVETVAVLTALDSPVTPR